MQTTPLPFQPSLLGTIIGFEDEDCEGMVTDETETAIYVESSFYTGWISKPVFYDSLMQD